MSRSDRAHALALSALLSMATLFACAPGASSARAGDAAPAPAPAVTPEPVDPALALAVFDSAWSRIHNSYYDTTFGGLDWVAVRDELRPAARDARTADSLRAVIRTMLERLGDSHFVVIPAHVADALDPRRDEASRDDPEDPEGEPGAPPGYVGASIRLVEGALTVTDVRPGAPAEGAGLRPGWVLVSIDTLAADALLGVLEEFPGDRRLAETRVAWAAESRLAGSAGDTVVARFVTGAGDTAEARMRAAPLPGTPVRFGNLPTMHANLDVERVPLDGGCAGVIAFDVWMTPILPPLEAAFQEVRECDGIVLDLRGNPGGVAGMVMGVSGYFLDERRPLGVLITRDTELRLVSMPRRVTAAGAPMRPYGGPLALLVDAQSMSTSEIFAAGLQEIGRARVFGERSGGQALPALMVRLPNQDVLMHVFANLVTPDGVRLEGRGVVPDEPVPLTRRALLEGRDPPLEAAIAWIRTEAGARGAASPLEERP